MFRHKLRADRLLVERGLCAIGLLPEVHIAQCIALVTVVVISSQLLERFLWRRRLGQRTFGTSPAPVSAGSVAVP